MATHTLSADTLISTLTLASGDTIQLAGHSIVVDMDAVSTPVSIANSGGDANLELRDLSRIKLNATLPSNVHPYIDPAHPLPVSDDAQAIDGDGYRTTLTANARAEIQLNGTFGLGGGRASVPTETRNGAFWALTAPGSGSGRVVFDRDFPLHKGDIIVNAAYHQSGFNSTCTVVSYDPQTKTATIDRSPPSSVGDLWFLIAGGVLVYRLPNSDSTTPFISAGLAGGTLNLLGYVSGSSNALALGVSCGIYAKRIAFKASNFGNSSNFYKNGLLFGNASVCADQVAADFIFADSEYSKMLNAKECATWFLQSGANDVCTIGGGFVNSAGKILRAKNAKINTISFDYGSARASIDLTGCTVDGDLVGGTTIEASGTVSREDLPGDAPILRAFYHSPATSSDTTWRYTDRTVKPHATIRIRALWKRGENSAATARTAITDPANWYALTQGGALAETVFPASANDGWQESRIAWRNDGDTDAQVRVWETVTGDTAGGYLKVEEVKGGQL